MRRKWYLGMLCLAIAGMLFVGGCQNPPQKTTVPDVMNFPTDEAVIKIEAAFLVSYPKEGESAPEEALEDRVYEQNPIGGTRVPKRSGVEFVYYGEYGGEPRPQRKMSILWVGDEKWPKDYGGTHIIGFHSDCWPWWYEGTDVKLIMYFKYKTIAEIEDYVRRFKDHPNNGGYWTIEYHEPDITGTYGMTIEENKRIRREQYQAIRRIDPDYINHPVIGVYDMTGNLAGYPGWEKAFPTKEEGKDCDIFFIDCYANKDDGTVDYAGMEAGLRLVRIGLERTEGLNVQFIPCIGATYPPNGKPASLVEQFEWWRDKLPGISAVAIWNSGSGHSYVGVYEDEYLAEEAREINRRLGLR